MPNLLDLAPPKPKKRAPKKNPMRICNLQGICELFSAKCPFPHGTDAEECPEFDYIYFKPKQGPGDVSNQFEGKRSDSTPALAPFTDLEKHILKKALRNWLRGYNKLNSRNKQETAIEERDVAKKMVERLEK